MEYYNRDAELASDGSTGHLYFGWLVGLVGASYISREYWRMLTILHKTPYSWNNEMDENRCIDGMELKREFEEQHGMLIEYSDILECTVLEMLIGVARRMNDIVTEGGYYTDQLFWELLDNLGLTKFDDETFYDRDGMFEVDYILDKWLSGQFERNGKGSPFPLKHSRKDQRIRDVWYQMNLYITENYYDY